MTMQGKRHYTTPKIKRVKLIPEEVVIAACKLGTGAALGTKCNRNSGSCSRSAAGT